MPLAFMVNADEGHGAMNEKNGAMKRMKKK
jgi:hypothetical protein